VVDPSPVTAVAASRVPEARGDDADADEKPDSRTDCVTEHEDDRRGVVDHCTGKPEQPSENGVAYCPPPIEQSVLTEIANGDCGTSRSVGGRPAAELFGVHRDQRPAHPETVCPTEKSDEEERREFELLARREPHVEDA
jgi:hypothetical protein